MPTITAYHAVRDSSFTLQPGDSGPTIAFNPSNDIRQDGAENRPLLCYRVDPSNNAANLALTVQVNGAGTGANATFSGGTSRAYMEILQNNLNLGNNNITFELGQGGSGSLRVSDVVVFYKRFVN